MIEIVIGIISGFVSAMGMGGGTILILCLTLFLGYEQHIAQASNLVFYSYFASSYLYEFKK